MTPSLTLSQLESKYKALKDKRQDLQIQLSRHSPLSLTEQNDLHYDLAATEMYLEDMRLTLTKTRSRCYLCRVCFWVGDLISKLPNWLSMIWYPLYSQLMDWSFRLDGEVCEEWTTFEEFEQGN